MLELAVELEKAIGVQGEAVERRAQRIVVADRRSSERRQAAAPLPAGGAWPDTAEAARWRPHPCRRAGTSDMPAVAMLWFRFVERSGDVAAITSRWRPPSCQHGHGSIGRAAAFRAERHGPLSPVWVYRMSHAAFESANTAYGQLS
jgi:hypothetical protein